MNLQAEKIQLMKLILETENPKILESAKKLFSKEKKSDFWTSLSDEQKADIAEGVSDIEKDNVVDYETVMRRHRK